MPTTHRVTISPGAPKPAQKPCIDCGPRPGSAFRVRTAGRLASRCRRCARQARGRLNRQAERETASTQQES